MPVKALGTVPAPIVKSPTYRPSYTVYAEGLGQSHAGSPVVGSDSVEFP